MIDVSTLLNHYKRQDIQKAILAASQGREIAVRFNDSFGARPNVLKYERDILEFAKQGATSFHCSEELWKDPMHLTTEMARKEQDELRIGWDLVLDVDCSILDYSKIAADLIVKSLHRHGITSCSAKFSGNKGFHIAVPYEAFPKSVSGQETRLLFPEAPKRIAYYLRELIRKHLAEKIMELEGREISKVAERTGKQVSDILIKAGREPQLNVESFLNIDTVLISSRHMFRMPYSLHEKSGLVSMPLDPDKILEFKREDATPKGLQIPSFVFLDRHVKGDEARKLLIQAYDTITEEKPTGKVAREVEIPDKAVPEELFPPCMKKILGGLDDGRKRGVFILVNFLSCMGWSYQMIEDRLRKWNALNREPLREVYILGQIKSHQQHKKKVLPPNCANKAYYSDMGVKCEEGICSRCKNPVNYVRRQRQKA